MRIKTACIVKWRIMAYKSVGKSVYLTHIPYTLGCTTCRHVREVRRTRCFISYLRCKQSFVTLQLQPPSSVLNSMNYWGYSRLALWCYRSHSTAVMSVVDRLMRLSCNHNNRTCIMHILYFKMSTSLTCALPEKPWGLSLTRVVGMEMRPYRTR